MKSYQQFFAELKRRRVFRVAGIYGIVSFGVLQAADLMLPRLGLPDWTVTFMVAIVVLAFPVALILAWAFEVTPEGVQKTGAAAPGEIEEIVALPASRRWPAGLLALAGVALLVAGAWWMGRRGTVGARDMNLVVAEAQAADFRTIAVLPFRNVGGSEEDRALAAGFHMDVQAQLARIAELRVTSPMSVQEYESTDKGIRDIANELSVDHILQGSVRRAGSKARVDVRLIDAATSENLWVTQFDEEVTPDNLFEIQSRIARAVADRLQAELTPANEVRLGEGAPTDDMAALNWYNRARLASFDFSRGGTLPEALDYAQRAVELDPDFAAAWALVATLRSKFVGRGESGADAALAAVERAEALAPGSAEALKARATYELDVTDDFERALELARTARDLTPSDAEILNVIGEARLNSGDWETAALRYRDAVALDPRNPARLFSLIQALRQQAMYAAADQVLDRLLQIDPSYPAARVRKVTLTADMDGDYDGARSLAAEMGLDVRVWEEAVKLTELAVAVGDWEEAERLGAAVPPDTLYLEELNRLYLRGMIRNAAGGDPTPFGDSLLALDQRGLSDAVSELVVGSAYLMTGDEERGWALVDAALRTAEASRQKYYATQVRGIASRSYAAFGRRDAAIELLDEIVATPGFNIPSLTDLTHHSRYASLRVDPRFEAILEKRRAYEEAAARRAEELGRWLP